MQGRPATRLLDRIRSFFRRTVEPEVEPAPAPEPGRVRGVVDHVIVLDGTMVTSADFSVDMTTVESDEDQRDNQFRGRIMQTNRFPTATFTLTAPIDLNINVRGSLESLIKFGTDSRLRFGGGKP